MCTNPKKPYCEIAGRPGQTGINAKCLPSLSDRLILQTEGAFLIVSLSATGGCQSSGRTRILPLLKPTGSWHDKLNDITVDRDVAGYCRDRRIS